MCNAMQQNKKRQRKYYWCTQNHFWCHQTIEQKDITFYHDFCHSFSLFSFLLSAPSIKFSNIAIEVLDFLLLSGSPLILISLFQYSNYFFVSFLYCSLYSFRFYAYMFSWAKTVPFILFGRAITLWWAKVKGYILICQ